MMALILAAAVVVTPCVDEVTVRWVGCGTETFTGVGVGGRYRLVEGTGAATAE